MIKTLARLAEIERPDARRLMERLNELACACGLREHAGGNRTWEYPWVWRQIEPFRAEEPVILDIGSERSPFPWFLAREGFRVIVSDVDATYWRLWRRAARTLRVRPHMLCLDATGLGLPAASVDVYLSVSVLEHVSAKDQVLTEAARVLRPGGRLLLTFDVCEPAMGMSFPEWNGRAPTLREFDDFLRASPWFEPGAAEIVWNTEDIPAFLAWHRTTAPHHNYVTGALALERNGRAWDESALRGRLHLAEGLARTVASRTAGGLRRSLRSLRRAAGRATRRAYRAAIETAHSPAALALLGGDGSSGRGEEIDLARVKRALVLRPDQVGDVVLASPFLREMRRNLPAAEIVLVVQPGVRNLVERCPHVNEVLTYESKPEGRRRLARRFASVRRLGRRLCKRGFDLAVLPRWGADHYAASQLAFLSGARWRVAYSENVSAAKRVANRGYDRFFTHVFARETVRHEVESGLELLAFIGGRVEDRRLELWLDPEDDAFAGKTLAEAGDHPLVAFAPGSIAPRKIWPIDRFAEIGRRLARERGARLVAVGGPGEEFYGRELRRQLGDAVLNLVGPTTLRQMGAVLKRCRLYVGNDSGPAHMAAAAGVPVVVVSCHPKGGVEEAAYSPVRFGPWGEGHAVLQPEPADKTCHAECVSPWPHCILGVNIEDVWEEVHARMSVAIFRNTDGGPP